MKSRVETVTDSSLKYKNLTFDIARSFNNGEWRYSYNSIAQFVNGLLIKAVMLDFTEMIFLKESKYIYVNQLSDSKLMMIYDEADENIIGCSIKTGSRSYGYVYDRNTFTLDSVSDLYSNSFDISRGSSKITIVDNIERECIIKCDNSTTTIADFSGGVISYNYDAEKLVSVTDQDVALEDLLQLQNFS